MSTFRHERIDEDDHSQSSYDTESMDCIKSAILAMCLVVQSQLDDDLSTKTTSLLLNKNSMRKLFKNFSLPHQLKLFTNTLDTLNESYRVDKFLKCFISRLLIDLIEYDKANVDALNTMSMDLDMNDDEAELKLKGKNAYFEFLVDMLAQLNLSRSPALVEYLIDSLFEMVIKQIDDFDDNTHSLPNMLVEFHLCELVYKFECKYPKEFDACLSKLLNASLKQKQRNYFLTTISCKFTSFKCKSTFKYQQIDKVWFYLYSSLLFRDIFGPFIWH